MSTESFLSVRWELLFIASACLGVSVFIALWTLLDLGRRPSEISDAYNYDEMRFKQLRAASWTFRHGERLLLQFASWYRIRELSQRASMTDDAKLTRGQVVEQAVGLVYPKVPWKSEEFLALRLTESLLVGGMTTILLWNLVEPVTGAVFGLVFGWTYYELQVQSIIEDGKRVRDLIRQRLPFVMDLMALTRGAGASFIESIETATRENDDHPIGDALGEVLRLLAHGRTQQQAMNGLADKVNEETVSELVFAINKADELGTPIAQTLAELADQMRLKRQQWGEKVAGEAQVKIMFPGIVIMVACIIVIIAPILLAALREFSS